MQRCEIIDYLIGIGHEKLVIVTWKKYISYIWNDIDDIYISENTFLILSFCSNKFWCLTHDLLTLYQVELTDVVKFFITIRQYIVI